VNEDPLKAKQLDKGLLHLCEEGIAQLFIREIDSRRILGVVGPLQFEVIQYRLEHEYSAKCRFENLAFTKAVWLMSDNQKKIEEFVKRNKSQIARDKEGGFVYLAETQWGLDREKQENPEIRFSSTSE
jgi:peptide chain release factor 3